MFQYLHSASGYTLRIHTTTLHNGPDFLVKSSGTYSPNYFILLDSRGISKSYSGSLASLMIHYLESNDLSYTLLCRPVNLTTWATLLSLFQDNKLSPDRIITNVGFVDFTPKKLELICQSIRQAEYITGINSCQYQYLENYQTSSGSIPLFSLQYPKSYLAQINALTSRISTTIINTPYVDPAINFPRPRPSSFYRGISKSNSFNQNVQNATCVTPPPLTNLTSYDALHYTAEGSSTIYKSILPHL